MFARTTTRTDRRTRRIGTGLRQVGVPVLLNLLGYVIGALILSPLADRFGRRDILLLTLLITRLGSLLHAFVWDYTTFLLARIITGIGVGADLALVATSINEVAHAQGRAKLYLTHLYQVLPRYILWRLLGTLADHALCSGYRPDRQQAPSVCRERLASYQNAP